MSDGRLIYAATADERRLAVDWHGGQGSMFYAVSSTDGYRVPLVPLVTIRATYDCAYFPDGEEDAATWGGWCDPSNPWGTLWGDDEYRADDDSDAYGRNGPPVELTLPVGEAARFLADFPGGIWDLCEGVSQVNYQTGVFVTVTAHADGPGAVAALTLAGEIMAGRR